MKKLFSIFLTFSFLLIGTFSLKAGTLETENMTGSIGKYPVVMKLFYDEEAGTIKGWYYYKSKGPANKIQLTGRIKGLPINFSELTMTESVNGKKTGTFKGCFWITGNGCSGSNGEWISPAGKKLEFDVMYDATR